MKNQKEYQRWENIPTWSIANSLRRIKEVKRVAREFVKKTPSKRGLYVQFIYFMGWEKKTTPDGIEWLDENISKRQLNRLMQEL